MAEIVVHTQSGAVRGAYGSVSVFRGIPFAAPPVGNLRWRPPVPLAPWSGVRAADRFGPDPMQMPLPMMPRRNVPMSEDCLTLNIWTPALDIGAPAPNNREKLPVMVWIPGGSFIAGSGADPTCDGENFARRGVVFVTINYRVGLFGFLAHSLLSAESEHRASGNYGLLDQIAALRWIRDNIGSFGGDADRVTAIGVSAGSASISLLLTSPLASGLFQRVILESPGSMRPLATLEDAEEEGQKLGTDLNTMRAMPPDAVLDKTSEFVPKVRGLTTPRVLRPICDGWAIERDERSAYLSGRFTPVPMIVGSNQDEGALFVGAWPVKTVSDYRQLVAENFGLSTQQALRLYPAPTDGKVREQCAFLFGDTQFTYGARTIALANSARQAATFRYLFSRKRGDYGPPPMHGEEVRYVFGTLASASNQPAPIDHDLSLSDLMMEAWVRFAATGDPNGRKLPTWPHYSQDKEAYLELGDEIRVGRGWRAAQMEFLDSFFDRREKPG